MKATLEAEQYLRSYGVSDPTHIDLEALAWTMGIAVKFRTLDSCEAKIVGVGDRAIITVDDRFGEKRARFSLAHEIGHWCRHRGQVLFCDKKNIGATKSTGSHKEREADCFAAELLMPRYLFLPELRSLGAPSFQIINSLATSFGVSRKAAALRFVDLYPGKCMLVCSGRHNRKWYRASARWSKDWIPKKRAEPRSGVRDLIFGTESHRQVSSTFSADAFFGHWDAKTYNIICHSIVVGGSDDRATREVMTLIFPEDEHTFQPSRPSPNF